MFGLELRRFGVSSNPAYQLLKGLENFDINLVFDIGANSGQFSSELRAVGYKYSIVSFEPLPTAYETLRRTAKNNPKWQLHSRCALGDHTGNIKINVSNNSVSSSILPMLRAHSNAEDKSKYIGSELVDITTLDDVSRYYRSTSTRHFIKIDTQGYETQVLNGAVETLATARGVLCELSLVPLYKGQDLWGELLSRLEKDGFTLWSIQPGFTDPTDGRTLQVDAIFFRT